MARKQPLKAFEKIVDDNAKEKVIQKHIFNHLWLLSPSWERADTDERMEKTVMHALDAESDALTKEEREGRLDISYRTVAGKHIVIELKKYKRKVTIEEISRQVAKYKRAVRKVLREKFPREPQQMEIICILGSPPTPDDDREANEEKLRVDNARFITYDYLINETRNSYRDYMEASKKIQRIVEITESLDSDDSWTQAEDE